MNNFKCAVLLSGESRTWELAKNNIKSFFERGVKCEFNNIHRPFKVDYFIHTWDTNSWRDPTQPHGTKDSFKLEVIPSNTKQKMEDFYNPKFIEIQPPIEFSINNPWTSMFYSFTKTNQFKRTYELENDFIYDIVIKDRLDTIYNTKRPLHIKKPDSDYGNRVMWSFTNEISKMGNEFNYFNFDDVAWFCDSPTMDMISNLVYTLPSNPPIDNFHKPVKCYYGPGALIYDFMSEFGIDSKAFHSFNYLVVRQQSMIDNLKYPDDIKLIRRQAMEFYQ